MSNEIKPIFVVDDDLVLGEVIMMMLDHAGYSARLFHDPVLALDAILAAEPAPDILITDYQMPGMNGLELIQACKKAIPTLKTISISGAMTEERLQQYHFRPDTILAKPFPPAALVNVLESMITKDPL